MGSVPFERLWELVESADNSMVRVEMVVGFPVWEAMPGPQHQSHVFRIQQSISRLLDASGDCGCHHYADTYVRFPDGSLKRPDISIFCREPSEKDEAITLLPEAVIEVISKGYEIKDLQIGLPFYLGQGVKDVLIFNPDTLVVLHARRNGTCSLVSPVDVRLECGCTCRI